MEALKVFNLIILDESGSMSGVTAQTISGCNETIDTIKEAQKKYVAQKQYVSIFAFQAENPAKPSRYLLKNVSADDVKHITNLDYQPNGATNLNDAVGSTLSDLKVTCKLEGKAIGSVTIITDGYENASTEYTTSQVAQMIEELKAMGWSFNFIGANIDVVSTAKNYHIDNFLEFQQDAEGTKEMFARERRSRMRWNERVEAVEIGNDLFEEGMSHEERLRAVAQGYFDERERVTPNRISRLAPNEIFVFGSNLAGKHTGGAARLAWTNFGAVMGQGVGLQGQSYAIPTVGVTNAPTGNWRGRQEGIAAIKPYVDEFIRFAQGHPELTFFVTRIGCGNAGFNDREMALLFIKTLSMNNVYLPQSFLAELA